MGRADSLGADWRRWGGPRVAGAGRELRGRAQRGWDRPRVAYGGRELLG